jgi:hypothetical protein
VYTDWASEISSTQSQLISSKAHILINLTSFMGNPNSMRALYNTSLLTES